MDKCIYGMGQVHRLPFAASASVDLPIVRNLKLLSAKLAITTCMYTILLEIWIEHLVYYMHGPWDGFVLELE